MASQAMADAIALALALFGFHALPSTATQVSLAEAAIKELTDQLRTLKMSPEHRVQCRLHNTHPVMAWLVEHSAYVLNQCELHTDGRTAYGRLHGK